MAEYDAYITHVEAAIDLKICDQEVYGDSILVISQVAGEWTIKTLEMTRCHKYLAQLKNMLRFIFFSDLLNTKNLFADALATLPLMLRIPM